MTTVDTGRRAEAAAAAFLLARRCRIVATNWRTRLCEIDIIAEREGIMYCCEVKYRKQARQGRGLDYITPAKLARMRFAAELWVNHSGWEGGYELAVLEVSGPEFRISAAVKGLG